MICFSPALTCCEYRLAVGLSLTNPFRRNSPSMARVVAEGQAVCPFPFSQSVPCKAVA